MIRYCRICRSQDLREIINLGNMHYTGKFKHQEEVVPQALLKLLVCENCGLTQLSNNFSLDKISCTVNFSSIIFLPILWAISMES